MIRELSSIYETKFQGRWQRISPSGRVDASEMRRGESVSATSDACVPAM